MYNRYIPQPDGTYRRNLIQDNSRHLPPGPTPLPPTPPPVPEPEASGCSSCIHRTQPGKPQPNYRPNKNTSISGFLRQLLPKDFDMEDLLVVLLLLLMAGDSQEDQNASLLTLALYLFL